MMIYEKVQFWKGTDARMIDAMVFCFVIPVCDITCINSDVTTAYFNLLLFFFGSNMQKIEALYANNVVLLGTKRR